MLVGMALVFFSSSFVDTGYGYQASLQAEAAANSGVQDALLQLSRNAAFSGTYTIPMGSSTVTVTVTQLGGGAAITSSATVAGRTKNMNATAAIDASTSKVNVTSWQAVQ